MLSVVFLPGYIATWIAYPKTKSLDMLTRAVISPALSIVLVFSSIRGFQIIGFSASSLVNSIIIVAFPTIICFALALYARRKGD